MANKKKAERINSERIRELLNENGISINKLAKELLITPRHLRRLLNEYKEMQWDQLDTIAYMTNTDVSDLLDPDPYISMTAEEDIYVRGKLAFKKGESLRLPPIGSTDYIKADLKEWDESMNALLTVLGIGTKLSCMTYEEKKDYLVHIESWIYFANKYYDALTFDQHSDLIETCEAIADRMVSKNQSQE